MQSLLSVDIHFTCWIAAAAKKILWHHMDPGKVLFSKWNEDKQQKRGTSLLILSANFPSKVIEFPFLFFSASSPVECQREEKSKTSVIHSKMVHTIVVREEISPITPRVTGTDQPLVCHGKADFSVLTFCPRAEWHLLSYFLLLPHRQWFWGLQGKVCAWASGSYHSRLGLQRQSGQGTHSFSYIYPLWGGKWM